MITEVLREHEDGTGFTMTTKDARSAFSMAEKMAFSGKKYSIKLGKEPGADWVVVVTEVVSDDGGCGYWPDDWKCREGGFLFDAGSGEGWDPEDSTYICPCCRTKEYLEDRKDDAESTSRYTNNGFSGTGLSIWIRAENTALAANEPEAKKALLEIGIVEALVADDSPKGYSVVLCNTRTVTS